MPKRYVLGYRIEFWPRGETGMRQMFLRAGLSDVNTRRVSWEDDYTDGGQVYDFFAATSAAWWTVRFPAEKVKQTSERTREYFKQRKATRLTQAIMIARGQKPLSG